MSLRAESSIRREERTSDYKVYDKSGNEIIPMASIHEKIKMFGGMIKKEFGMNVLIE